MESVRTLHAILAGSFERRRRSLRAVDSPMPDAPHVSDLFSGRPFFPRDLWLVIMKRTKENL